MLPSSDSCVQENPDPSVAFTVVIKREGNDVGEGALSEEETLVNVTHHAVTGAVQEVRGSRLSLCPPPPSL